MTEDPSEIFAFADDRMPERVGRLPPPDRAAFAAGCAARLLRQHPPRLAPLAEKAVLAAWLAIEEQSSDEGRSLLSKLDRLGEELDDDAMAAAFYALRAALDADVNDAVLAAERGIDASFAAAENEVVAGYAVTKEDNEACASTPVVQDEYRRQLHDLLLLERDGLTAEVREALQRP
jgi:hypothetical protein